MRRSKSRWKPDSGRTVNKYVMKLHWKLRNTFTRVRHIQRERENKVGIFPINLEEARKSAVNYFATRCSQTINKKEKKEDTKKRDFRRYKRKEKKRSFLRRKTAGQTARGILVTQRAIQIDLRVDAMCEGYSWNHTELEKANTEDTGSKKIKSSLRKTRDKLIKTLRQGKKISTKSHRTHRAERKIRKRSSSRTII